MKPRALTPEQRSALAEAREIARRSLATPRAQEGALVVTADGQHFPGVALHLPAAVGLSVGAVAVALAAARAATRSSVSWISLWVPRASEDHPRGETLQVWQELAPRAPLIFQRGADPARWLARGTLLPDAFTRFEAAPDA